VGPALSPAVHGARTFRRRVFPLHLGGLLIGGVSLGLVAAAAGAALALLVPSGGIRLVLGVMILLYAVAEIGPWKLWRPQSLWQVPEQFRRTPYVGLMAFLWGVPLGFGWLTANVTSAFLVTFIAMLAVPAPVALAAGISFSLSRAATLLLTLGSDDFEAVADRFEHFGTYKRTARTVTAIAGLSLALALFALPAA
jgi:hypothetical protein